jgi:1,4-alpha-glucan branching enzyme
MLEKEKLENGWVRVTFRLSDAIWAESIALVGEFNNWDTHTHLLSQTHGDLSWHISVELELGHTYRFRYLVNGEEWMDDDHADGYEPNSLGGFDCIVQT